jgi:hypothetical protein
LSKPSRRIYYSPDGDCKTLRKIPDLLPLLAECPQKAMDEFEAKIDLSSRLAPIQSFLR